MRSLVGATKMQLHNAFQLNVDMAADLCGSQTTSSAMNSRDLDSLPTILRLSTISVSVLQSGVEERWRLKRHVTSKCGRNLDAFGCARHPMLHADGVLSVGPLGMR